MKKKTAMRMTGPTNRCVSTLSSRALMLLLAGGFWPRTTVAILRTCLLRWAASPSCSSAGPQPEAALACSKAERTSADIQSGTSSEVTKSSRPEMLISGKAVVKAARSTRERQPMPS